MMPPTFRMYLWTSAYVTEKKKKKPLKESTRNQSNLDNPSGVPRGLPLGNLNHFKLKLRLTIRNIIKNNSSNSAIKRNKS